jgi:hypothetical protein
MMGQDKEKKAEAEAWTTYMVFEAQGDYQAAPDAHYRAMGVLPPRLTEPELPGIPGRLPGGSRGDHQAHPGVPVQEPDDDAPGGPHGRDRGRGKGRRGGVPIRLILIYVGLAFLGFGYLVARRVSQM